MDDMDAFERQLASRVARMSGPEPRFDSVQIAHAAATQSPRWRLPSMFNAAKFVVAGAIVALFGGFLLAGVLTQKQGDESLPAAAASASASVESLPTIEPAATPETAVTTDLLPGVDLVTQEVEPGVLRVVSDGIRDIARPLPECSYCPSWMTLTAGLDGSVWLSPGRLFKGDRALPTAPGHELPFRLGYPVDPRIDDETSTADGAPHDAPSGFGPVGPDGALWVRVVDDGIWSFAERPGDDAWQQFLDSGRDFAIAPDGSVWTIQETFGKTFLGHSVDGGEWDSWEIPIADGPSLVGISGEGDVWVRGVESDARSIGRFDGSDWQILRAPLDPWLVDVGPDGTLWANSRTSPPLARFDGTDWTEYDEADGVPPMGLYEWPIDIEVAPDGSVWVNSIRREASQADDGSIDDTDGQGYVCGGVHDFDGTTWTRYLRDICVYDMDIAPDGTVWLRGGTFDLNADPQFESVAVGPVELYVIRPKVAAATE